MTHRSVNPMMELHSPKFRHKFHFSLVRIMVESVQPI